MSNNIQFNATSLKKFRGVVAKYYVAKNEVKDFILTNTVIVNGLKAALSADEDDIKRLDNGETVIRDRATIESSIADLTAKLEARSNALASARERSAKACADAESLITPALYDAYVSYVEAKGDGDEVAYATAIAEWLKAQGATDATPENCMGFVGLVGLKNTSARAGLKDDLHRLTKAQSVKVFTTLFVGALADNLVNSNLVSVAKYKFVPVTTK